MVWVQPDDARTFIRAMVYQAGRYGSWVAMDYRAPHGRGIHNGRRQLDRYTWNEPVGEETIQPN